VVDIAMLSAFKRVLHREM